MRVDVAVGAAELAGDELANLGKAFGRRRIGGHELSGKEDRAQGKADGFAHALVLAEGDLAATAAEVDEEDAAAGAGLGHEGGKVVAARERYGE
jgi:hypothetical protein